MSQAFDSIEQAFMALSNPADPQWGEAFRFLAAHPETARMMLDTFQDTLKDMGAQPGGVDPSSGEPVYTLQDVARALGIPESDLDSAIDDAVAPSGGAADER